MRTDRRWEPAAGGAPRLEVAVQDTGRERLGEASPEEEARDEVEAPGQRPAGGAAHDGAEDADPQFAVERPGERVPDDQAADQLRPASCEAEDRPAPVL